MMSRRRGIVHKTVLFFVCVVGAGGVVAFGADWPQWRYDAGRTAASPEQLPDQLHLQWVRRLPPPEPAWAKYPRLCFDVSYEPVVQGETMFVPSMVTDSVTALETDTGAQRWRFYTDGPVRLAPVAFDGKVCFVSDDGHLYCVDAADGRLLWKYRGLPSEREDRKVLGNDRVISLWPARGGPVLADGRIYFAAGVWPFEGVYVHAVDAQTGKPVWTNREAGYIERGLIDHSTRQAAGLSPQGYLAVIGEKLFVPSGRALAATLDRKTGALEPYSTGWGGRDNLEKGCWYVSGNPRYYFQSGEPYDLATRTRVQIDPANAKELGEFREPVLTEQAAYCSLPVNRQQGYRPAGVGYDRLVAWDLTKAPELKEWEDGQNRKWRTGDFDELWSVQTRLKVHIKAGSRLYAGAEGTVAALALPNRAGSPKVVWKARIEGTPSRMLAAAGTLFVVTKEGSIYAFGPRKTEPKDYPAPSRTFAPEADQWTQTAGDILKATGAGEGYCLMFGVGSGRLAEELLRQSQLRIVAVDSDADRVQKLRTALADAGLYGTRIAVHQGDPVSYPFPPYVASLVVSEERAIAGHSAAEFVGRVFRVLRPYGGVACLPVPADRQDKLAAVVEAAGLTGTELTRASDCALLRRVGGPAGSADWTHEDADAGRSLVSRDKRVKEPLGVLWFGGAVDTLFPEWDFTHSRSTTPLVAGGRMFFQVFPKLHAVDIYTGRHLWTTTLPGTDLNAQRRNLSYAATEDSVYVASGRTCVRFDAATGAALSKINSPGNTETSWREVRIWNDCLIGSAGRTLVCIDRQSERIRWSYQAAGNQISFAVGDGRVFVGDASLPDRRGEVTQVSGRLAALDLRDGNELWKTDLKLQTPEKKEQKPPTLRLVYSEANDVLLTVYTKVSAYDGSDGALLWGGQVIEGGDQPILHRDQLITQAGETYDPRTGSRLPRRLFSGRRRGCTRVIGGEHLLMIRNAHASYLDLASARQTFFRGIRAGCTNNLIPAGGILTALDFSHGCACNYAVFASMALVHLPGVDE